MGRKPHTGPPIKLTRAFKYGMPLYGAAWPEGNIFFLCGGGGSTNSGIKNRVVFAESVSGHLTDQVGEHLLGQDCPMRMAISPNGKNMVLAMGQGGIKRLDLDLRGKIPKITDITGDLAARIKDEIKGEIKALTFHHTSDQLALGWADGSVVVMDWPSLRPRLDLRETSQRLPDSIRDIDMAKSPRQPLVSVVLDDGTCQIWNWDKGVLVVKAGLARGEYRSDLVITMSGPGESSAQPLPRGMHGAKFARLRFAPAPPSQPPSSGSQADHPQGAGGRAGSNAQASTSGRGAADAGGGSGVQMYALMNNRQGCWVAAWQMDLASGMLTLQRWKRLGEAPGAALDVSPDGSLLAVSTSEGAAMVLSSDDLSTIRSEPKAHMVFSTGIVFAADGSHALSISADASATALPTRRPPKMKGTVSGYGRVLMLLIIGIALLLVLLLAGIRILKIQERYDLLYKIYTLKGGRLPFRDWLPPEARRPTGQCSAEGGVCVPGSSSQHSFS